MNSDVLALVIRARDEASGEFKKIEHALGQLKDKADIAGRGMGALHDILKGIGAGIGIAIFTDLTRIFEKLTGLIPDLIGKGMKFGEQVHDLMLKTGGTAEATSRLIGIYEFLGINSEGLGLKIGKLAKTIVDHEKTMTAYGIAVRDVAGRHLDMITIIDNARTALDKFGAGADRTAAAVKLFGRAGAEMIPYLSLSADQVQLLNDEMDKLGITMDEAGVAKAAAASKEFNLFGLSVQGVANKLFSDVAPALMQTVDQLASWVAKNGTQIATFAANVANFVLGMISAITGATFQTVTFADKFGALAGAATGAGGAIDATAGKTRSGAGASRAAAQAVTEHIKAIDAQLASVKALETEQDKAFSKQMSQLNTLLGAQLSALSAKEKAHAIDEQQASLARQLSDAQSNLATAGAGTGGIVDPKAVESAQDQVTQIMQSQADLQTQIVDDARREVIRGLQEYVKAQETAEKDAKDKAKFVTAEKAADAILQSQIAAAALKGDAQAVADLQVKLEANHTAEARAQQAIRNGDRTTDLEKQKAHFEAIKAAAAGAATGAGGIGPVFTKGSADAGKAIALLREDGTKGFGALRGSLTGAGGVAGAFDDARRSGMAFGESMKAAMVKAAAALKGVLDGLGWIVANLDKIGTAFNYLTNKDFRDAVTNAAKQQGNPLGGLADLLGGLGDQLRAVPLDPLLFPGHADGGFIPPGTWGMTGERGPEAVYGGKTGATVTPNGAMGGTTNVTINVPGSGDPEATARSVLQALKRELGRQGMSLAS